jgi:glycosyltransferase involved in cell wall biosynthesis
MNTINRDAPLVSIVVTTRNEEEAIGKCLESIRRQTYKKTEILVVDNASGDRTQQVARQFTNHVFDKGPERSAQRNYGARMAKGYYVLFLDADMVLSRTVIEECVRSITRKIHALIIPEKSQGRGFWAKCKALERTYYEGVGWMEAARFYNKNTFVSLGGFDVDLTGPEDFDLSQRVIARYGPASISRITSYIYHNEGRIIFWDLLRKKYYYGKKMRRYMNKNENRSAFQKQANPLSRYVLFFQKPAILFSDPIHAVGMIIMKTLELGALALGTLAGHI